MTRKDIPNVISVFRILLVAPVVIFILDQRFVEALLLFVVAGVSDGIDGYLARRFQWQSRLGSVLDPLADKLLLVSSFIALGWLGLMPVWMVGLVIIRDVVIVAGGVAYHFLIGQYAMEPTMVSKLNTVLELLLVVSAMLIQAGDFIPFILGDVILYMTAMTIIFSGIGYVAIWSKRAIHALNKKTHSL